MFASAKTKSRPVPRRPIGKAALAQKGLGVLVALLFACTAHAQQDRFDAHVADMVILMAKPVQNAIGLTEAQRSTMNTYAKQFDGLMSAYRQQLIKTKGKPDGRKIGGYQLNLRSHVLGQLNAGQLKRLRELSLQHDGVVALADEVVANKVGLSASQLKKIRDIITADRDKMASLDHQAQKAAEPVVEKYRALKPKSEAEAKGLEKKLQGEISAATSKYRPQVRQIVIQDRAQITSVLNSQQKNTWNLLLGKPFSG